MCKIDIKEKLENSFFQKHNKVIHSNLRVYTQLGMV